MIFQWERGFGNIFLGKCLCLCLRLGKTFSLFLLCIKDHKIYKALANEIILSLLG